MGPSLTKYSCCFLSAAILLACGGKGPRPSKEIIDQLHLKTGEIISCGPPDKEFGTVDFDMGYNGKVKRDFDLAVELLHSFEYGESEKAFAKIIAGSPDCAMAYWGIAMCMFHPLWEPPTDADLGKGAKAVEIANSIGARSKRESAYINAIGAYYQDWDKTSARARSKNFERAMERLHDDYPDDKEAAIFYALSLDASADPVDKAYTNQKKAGAILNALYGTEPDHPGIVHYIIHTYDYPGIADLGLAAARRYAAVAPSSAHALHMPSHIFTRLGLWDDCIRSNERSIAAAKCYAGPAGIKGPWEEELHGIDYLVYALLQKGDNDRAIEQRGYLAGMNVFTASPKAAYTFAAVPSRMALENKNWQEAANIKLCPAGFPWDRFPWQEAIVHFARLLGAVHTSDMASAKSELIKMNALRDTLQTQKDFYKAKQVAVQIRSGEAWIAFASNRKTEALHLMKTAADMEDSTSKHPVTPGEVLPARELYGDMLLLSRQYVNAFQTYKEALQKSPNRFNSLYGAALAAEKSGNISAATPYYKQLVSVADPASRRPELLTARLFLKRQKG